jgi:hypothetical protein
VEHGNDPYHPSKAPLNGAGLVCSSACLSSTWSGVLAVRRAACGSSRPSPVGPLFSIPWRRLLSHLKLAPDPPLDPARLEQGRFAWASASPTRDDRVFGPPHGRGATARSDPVAPRARAGDPRLLQGTEGASSEPTRGGIKRLNPVDRTWGGTRK